VEECQIAQEILVPTVGQDVTTEGKSNVLVEDLTTTAILVLDMGIIQVTLTKIAWEGCQIDMEILVDQVLVSVIPRISSGNIQMSNKDKIVFVEEDDQPYLLLGRAQRQAVGLVADEVRLCLPG
jgi:hypothetical protein